VVLLAGPPLIVVCGGVVSAAMANDGELLKAIEMATAVTSAVARLPRVFLPRVFLLTGSIFPPSVPGPERQALTGIRVSSS
jgi:hypothetical protein